LFAAGNGNESVDNDGYASYAKVTAVAACNDQSKRSVYSDFGNAVWCAFPSSDFGYPPFNHPNALTPGIWTTDRLGNFGYNPGNTQFGDAAGKFTNDFGGTSSACPGAAGLVALVLSANPDLRWNEVKDILRRACDPIDPQGGQYDASGHSKFYGYGRLNAETAVKLATQAAPRVVTINKLLNVPIPDLGSVEGTLDATETTPVGKVAVYVRLAHTYIGDLVITVVPPAPSGLSPVVLHNRAGGSRDNLEMLYDASNTPALDVYAGKKCHGTWTVRVEDKAAQDSGTLMQIALHLFLSSPGEGTTTTQPNARSAVA
jgi:subtilisin-like proprotein convertase family protein